MLLHTRCGVVKMADNKKSWYESLKDGPMISDGFAPRRSENGILIEGNPASPVLPLTKAAQEGNLGKLDAELKKGKQKASKPGAEGVYSFFYDCFRALEVAKDDETVKHIVDGAKFSPQELKKLGFVEKNATSINFVADVAAVTPRFGTDLRALKRLLPYMKENLNEINSMHILYEACEYGRHETVELCLNGGLNANAKEHEQLDGIPALSLAIQYRRKEITELLLKHGADVNARDTYDTTPLMYAAASGREDVVRLLLDHGANPNLNDINGKKAINYSRHSNINLMLAQAELDMAKKTKPVQAVERKKIAQ